MSFWCSLLRTVVSGPHYPAFVLNMEIYRLNLSIRFECRKMQSRKTLNTDICLAVVIVDFEHTQDGIQYIKLDFEQLFGC